MEVTFRPIEEWPGEETERRLPSRYEIGWQQTLEDLKRELAALGAEHVVVQLTLKENRIRRDGWPRADANPEDPRPQGSLRGKRATKQRCGNAGARCTGQRKVLVRMDGNSQSTRAAG